MDNNELINEVQANFSTASLDAYRKIRDSYLTVLHSNYDKIRDEICKCITFECYQASITLTNHLLEMWLKDSLIFNECGSSKLDSPEMFEVYNKAVDKFDGLDLSDTINRARTADVITREEKEQLRKFRVKFRNAYGHAEKKKLFADQKPVNYIVGKLDGTPGTPGAVSASGFFVAHGLMQAEMAANDAIPYFLYVDEILVREEIKRHPEIKEKPELFKRHFNFKQ